MILKSILPYKTVNYLFIYKENKEHDALNKTKGEMKSAWKMCGVQYGSKNRNNRNGKGEAAMQHTHVLSVVRIGEKK